MSVTIAHTVTVSFGLIMNNSGSKSHMTNLDTGAILCGAKVRGLWAQYAIQGAAHYAAQAARRPETSCQACADIATALDARIAQAVALV